MATVDRNRPDADDLAALGMTEAEFMAQYESAPVLSDETRIVSARYDRTSGRVVIDLANRMTLMIPTDTVQALADAKPEELERVKILGSHSLDWPAIDQQVYIPDLLKGISGSRRWMASQLGKSRSTAKATAARANGKKGGRPRKSAP